MILTEKDKFHIKRIKKFAEENIVSFEVVKQIAAGLLPLAGDDINHTAILDSRYRIVFSIENQPAGNIRHFSISHPHKIENSDVEKIITELGYEGTLNQCITNQEEYSAGKFALNVWQKI